LAHRLSGSRSGLAGRRRDAFARELPGPAHRVTGRTSTISIDADPGRRRVEARRARTELVDTCDAVRADAPEPGLSPRLRDTLHVRVSRASDQPASARTGLLGASQAIVRLAARKRRLRSGTAGTMIVSVPVQNAQRSGASHGRARRQTSSAPPHRSTCTITGARSAALRGENCRERAFVVGSRAPSHRRFRSVVENATSSPSNEQGGAARVDRGGSCRRAAFWSAPEPVPITSPRAGTRVPPSSAARCPRRRFSRVTVRWPICGRRALELSIQVQLATPGQGASTLGPVSVTSRPRVTQGRRSG